MKVGKFLLAGICFMSFNSKYWSENFYVEVKDIQSIFQPTDNFTSGDRKEFQSLRTQCQERNDNKQDEIQKLLRRK